MDHFDHRNDVYVYRGSTDKNTKARTVEGKKSLTPVCISRPMDLEIIEEGDTGGSFYSSMQYQRSHSASATTITSSYIKLVQYIL